MPSTYSQDLRIELIAGGDQSGTWGSTTNNNLGNLIEDAISGAAIIPIDPGSGVKQAIIAANGAVDQARCSALILTGATDAFEIYAPPVTKLYVVRNECSFQATLWCATSINGTTSPVGATGYIIPAGKTAFVHTPDGLQFYDAVNYLNTALPASSGGTGFQTYAIGDLLYANTTTTLAKLPDVATGNVLRSGGVNTAPAWGQVNLATDITGNLPVNNLGGGTGASSTTFWRGDGTWQTPGGGGNVSFSGTSPIASVNQVVVYGATGTAITTGRTYQFRADSTGPAQIQLFEDTDNGTESVTLQAPASIATGASATYTLPSAVPAVSGYVLSSTTAGVMSWVAQPTGTGDVTGPASSTTNAIPTFNGTTGKIIQNNSAVTISAGTITATGFSGSFSGSGASITALNGSNISSGTVAAARLPTAGSAAAGILSTGAQNIAGAKTFDGNVSVGGSLNATGGFTSASGMNFDANNSIYLNAGTIQLDVATLGVLRSSSGNTNSGSDNGKSLGTAALRWSVVYAGTGTINTSDVNTKQDIADLDAAEKRVAANIKGLVKKFRFKDAVEEKGADARIHVGVIAQEVQAAFVAEGLDASHYALFCSDTWWEKEEEIDTRYGKKIEKQIYTTPVEGGVQKTRLGVRYEELLAFVIAAM